MAQTCGNIVVHFIFSTKCREPLLTIEVRSDMHAYLGGIVRELRGTAIVINGTSDHVHMLVRIRPTQSVAGDCARGKDKFFKMDPRKRTSAVCLASWLRRVQRK